MDGSLLSTLGILVSIFLTMSILSFLYDDNPIYKFAEHLFMGVGIGVGTVETYYGVFYPKLINANGMCQTVMRHPRCWRRIKRLRHYGPWRGSVRRRPRHWI